MKLHKDPHYSFLSEPAKHLLVRAGYAAAYLNDSSIDCEHIMYAFAEEREGIVARVLADLGITNEKISKTRSPQLRGQTDQAAEPELSARAHRCIEYAYRHAIQLNHSKIGIEHLLLGLLDECKFDRDKIFETQALETDEISERILTSMRVGTTRTGVPGERPTILAVSKEGQPSELRSIPIIEIPDNYSRVMPAHLAQMAAQHGPIFRAEWAPNFTVVYMIGPEANQFVLKTHRLHFSNDLGWTPNIGEVLGRGLLNMDDPEHERYRRLLEPRFTQTYLSQYLSLMQKVIDERIKDWIHRSPVDLVEELRKIAFDIAVGTLTGFYPSGKTDRLRELFKIMLNSQYDPSSESEAVFRNRVMEVRDQIDDYLLTIIWSRRQEVHAGTVLDVLLDAYKMHDDSTSDKQVLGQLKILLVGGHETTASVGAWLLYLLSIHQQYAKRILRELEGVGSSRTVYTLDDMRMMTNLTLGIKETTRLYPPIGNAPRGVIKEFVFNGHVIPVGTRVVYSIAASHRLPYIFHNPDLFDPDRYLPPREEDKIHPFALVPFGGGVHACLGLNFAQLELKAIATRVLAKYSLLPTEGQEIYQAYPRSIGFPQNGIFVNVESALS